MHFLVFGATGACGSKFCNAAIEQGHQITIFARSPDKLPRELLSHKQVQVVQGALTEPESLEKASECGADAFVSFAGPALGGKGTPITDGYQKFLPMIASKGIKRALILCTPSFRRELDTPSFIWKVGSVFMKTFSSSQYWEMIGIGNCVVSQPVEELQWTLFRVGRLTEGPEGPVTATHLGSGKDNMSISRASIARWVLEEAVENRWVGQSPYICNV